MQKRRNIPSSDNDERVSFKRIFLMIFVSDECFECRDKLCDHFSELMRKNAIYKRCVFI